MVKGVEMDGCVLKETSSNKIQCLDLWKETDLVTVLSLQEDHEFGSSFQGRGKED